jgi:hypothetical protein
MGSNYEELLTADGIKGTAKSREGDILADSHFREEPIGEIGVRVVGGVREWEDLEGFCGG